MSGPRCWLVSSEFARADGSMASRSRPVKSASYASTFILSSDSLPELSILERMAPHASKNR